VKPKTLQKAMFSALLGKTEYRSFGGLP